MRTRNSRPVSRKQLTLFMVIFGAIGLVLLCVTAFLATSAVSFARTADRTTGEVVGLEKGKSRTTSNSRRSCSDVWAPRVTFTTSFWRLAFPALITGGLGLVFSGIAVLLVVLRRRRPARPGGG